MPEFPRHNPEDQQMDLLNWKPKTPPAEEKKPPQDGPTIEDARRYFIEHLHEPGLEDTGHVLEFKPIEWLPFFEQHSEFLRQNGSPELYRARQLVHLLDKAAYSGGHIKYELHDVSQLISDWALNRFRLAPKGDSLEITEARAECDQVLNPLQTYERIRTIAIEPVIAIVEERISDLNNEIERIDEPKNKDPRHEREKRGAIDVLKEERKKWRRARIFLLTEYFGK